MLALAIISTVILGIFIQEAFISIVTTNDEDDEVAWGSVIVFLGFVIVAIWVLYAR